MHRLSGSAGSTTPEILVNALVRSSRRGQGWSLLSNSVVQVFAYTIVMEMLYTLLSVSLACPSVR